MHIPTDPQSTAILKLEAQVQAHRFMLGLLFADNEAALAALKKYGGMAEDSVSQFLMTDSQIAEYKAEIDTVTSVVDSFVAFVRSRTAT